MSVTVRFAPSPTGNIHIGNTRTVMFNALYALKHGGAFILRFDDTDIERSRDEYARQIATDLDWLGIKPVQTVKQSDRFALYDAAADKLRKAGLLYACYETAEELDLRRKVQLSRRLPPVYDRAALKLTDAQKAAYEAEGRKAHWRFLLPNFDADPFKTERRVVEWDDVVRGPQTVDLASLSDPVLIREDGTYLYTLPSVVDDIDMGITHVIRGDDHVTNTGVQIAIFEALAGKAPQFGHHNLLTTASGEGLSKRSGALSLKSLREDGVEPMAVASLAALIGTSSAVEAVGDLETLAARFEPDTSAKSSSKFDPEELWVLNKALVHQLSFEEVKPRLKSFGIAGPKAEAFWILVRGNLTHVAGAALWWKILTQGPDTQETLTDDDLAFVQEAFDHLPPEPWGRDTWKLWTDVLKQSSGRKGRQLFAPLRVALTGRSSGPELADLLPLLGREETLARRP